MLSGDEGGKDDENQCDTVVAELQNGDLSEDADGREVGERSRAGRAATSRHGGLIVEWKYPNGPSLMAI